MARTNVGRFGQVQRDAYLDGLANGLRRGAAAAAAGVTRSGVCKYYTRHPEYLEAIELAEIAACDQVEDALYQAAISGNVVACQVWLYNRWPARWMDKRNVQLSGVPNGATINVQFTRREEKPNEGDKPSQPS